MKQLEFKCKTVFIEPANFTTQVAAQSLSPITEVSFAGASLI